MEKDDDADDLTEPYTLVGLLSHAIWYNDADSNQECRVEWMIRWLEYNPGRWRA